MWKLGLCTILGAAALAALPVSPSWSPAPSLSLDTASARIGHPLSPGSVAGVNRRINRRAAGAGYYGGGGLYDYAPGAVRRAAYGYGAPAIVEDAGYEDAGYSASAATPASSPIPLNPAEHAYCMSRTFNAGPC